MDSVQKTDLADFVYDSEVAKATRHKRYRHLRAFLNWCEDEGYVQNPPDILFRQWRKTEEKNSIRPWPILVKCQHAKHPCRR
jgi:hypothetical protein